MDEAHERLLAIVEDNDEDAEILLSIVRAALRAEERAARWDSWSVLRYDGGEGFLAACGIAPTRESQGEPGASETAGPAHADHALPDLVLLDLNLPGLDGLAILRMFRANTPTRAVPVLILTTSTNPRDVTAAYEAGANGYHRKPVDLEAFERLVEGIVRLWTRETVLPLPSRNRIRP